MLSFRRMYNNYPINHILIDVREWTSDFVIFVTVLIDYMLLEC